VGLLLERGVDPNARWGPLEETVLHTAVRRRRLDAVQVLLAHGAEVDAATRHGDTAWRHALRRPFPEVAACLAAHGARTETTPADDLAVALLGLDLEGAAAVLRAHPSVIADLVPEEARLLGDLAGQGKVESVRFLLEHGADLEARGLDGGTPLQQTAWFGTPAVTRLLLERGADANATGCDHRSTPMGWLAHGSRYSGGAQARQEAYLEVLELLLAAGARLDLPWDPPDRPGAGVRADASERVRERLARL
jgi:ankyrin repeat protein